MRCWLIEVLLVFFGTQMYAQGFGARVILGLNASQIAGDQLAGFDKVGLSGGLQGTVFLTEKFDLNVEFLYNEKGSRPDIFNGTLDPDIHITLRYIELPVFVTVQDWLDEEAGYYKAFGQAGLSVGRLMSVSTADRHNPDDMRLDDLVDHFNNTDVSWLVGFGFRLSQRWAISFRYTRSLNLLLNAKKQELNTFSLRPYFLSFRGEYIL
ncbi:MAG: porin family protein [Saprospiraceae bacterium]|nr:porin family protein [Saprospiraceae bacterium]